MKKTFLTKALSMLLALVMVMLVIPAAAIPAFATGVPDMLVTSLTELYGGDEVRAKEDLEAMYAAGLINSKGKMVDLNIREDGKPVALTTLADRIANGDKVGEITVNGESATAAQILKISQVNAAIEIAELLEEEINVTDGHVENLEELIKGIQNGTVDLEGAVKSGALRLTSTNNASLGSWSDITQFATTRWSELPTALTLTEDGTSFIGPYISGSTYDPNHAFFFESGLSEFVNGNTGANNKTDDVVTESNTRRNMFDWDRAIVGVDNADSMHPIVTVVLPLRDDDAVQNQIASDVDEGKLLDITDNGVGLKMELPVYGEVSLRYVFRYMYFSNNDKSDRGGGSSPSFSGQNPRYPVYLVESEVNGETRVTAVATRFTAPSNTGDKVRRDALSLFVNPRGSATDDEWTSEEYDWDQICRKDHRFLPENWSDFLVDANGFRYYSPDEVYEAEKARLWAIVEEKYAYMESVDFLDYGPAYSEYSAALNAHSDYYHEGLSSFTTAIAGRCLPYYIAPAFLISGSKYIERPEGSWEQAEAGFIKLKNPENPDFPYVYPKDIENPQNQYDVELMYTEDFYQVYVQGYTRMGEDLDLRIAMRLSNRLNFYVPEGVLTWWQGGFLKTVTDDGRGVTVIPNEITDYGTVHADAKPFGGDSYDRAFNLGVSTSYFKIKDAAPYLLIPRSSRIRETMMLLGTDIQFSSNITKHNKYATIFKAELYRIREDQIDINATSIPDDAEKIEVPDWGNYASPVKDPVTENEYDVTHVTVPGSALDKAGVYAVKISVEFSDGDEVQTLSSVAYIKAKQIPTTIKIDKLESTYADKDNVPSITYSLEYAVQNAEVKYTIQQAGSSDIIEGTGSVSGGTISIPEVSFEGLKTAYTITVYARNSEEDPWSTDSVLITVYNNDILDILIKDVAFGELGGTTGGLEGNGTEVVSGTTVNLDNKAKIEALLDKAGEGAGFAITFDDLLSLRSDIGLMRIVSANYGDGTWGAISDRIKWTYTDSNGKTSSGVTLNNKENGAYADLRSHSHTSYVPSTDFILVATDDRSDDAPVTITATHASSGVTRSFQVTVNTLHDRFYMFRFLPKATTYVSYTNGDGVQRTLHSNENGELAVYEPSGIASDILTMSEVDGETYAGTYFKNDLVSGEKDLVKAELYPCNNLKLLPISSQTVTILKPDGTPYSGKVTIRAGVYKGGVYCPDVGVRASKDEGDPILRSDVVLTAVDGKIEVYYDPIQLTADNGMARGLKYVYEYRIDGYQPGYVIINPFSKNPTDFIISLQNNRGNATAPQITRQEYQQYLNGTRPTSYIRNVIDYTDNIGISPNFPKSILYTDIALPGETVGVGENVNGKEGYSTYEGSSVVKFAFYTTDGKKLTGQTDLSGESVKATQITNLNQLSGATYFIFPFSAVPMLRSTYVMTDADMRADGIDDTAKTPTARIAAVFTRGAMTVGNINMPFGVTNVSNQPNLTDKNDGAKAIGKEVRDELRDTTDIGAIFRSINVNDMIRKGFVFLGNLAGAGGDNFINLMILPTQDPATFRIIAFVGSNQRPKDDDDGVSVNFNANDLAEDMNKLAKELEDSGKKKDSDSDGEGSMEFNFYGTIILEARAGVADGKWKIAFRGGNVGANVKGKYEWGQTFFCGPYPAFISFEIGFHADLEVAFGNKGTARAMLLDAALGVSIEAFAGLGFDLSIVALQLGIYGRIGADVNFLLLTPSNAAASTGTKLTISGEIGIKLKIKLLFISYSKKFASTGFNWTKKWNKYDQIKNYWNDQGYGELFGFTKSGRAYTMFLFADGSAMVAIDGGAELESRDYLELEERVWTSGSNGGRRLFKAIGSMTDVQTNAYPYSHPAFTDDGEMFFYISDNDNAKDVESVTSYAVKNGNGYDNMGRVDTSEDNVLADLDVVASGTKDNAFAAWVKQIESPKTEKGADITNDDLGMMFNATEIYVTSFNGTSWTTTRLTDNNVADMSPTVASHGNRAIVAWRSMSTSSMPNEARSFDGSIYNEGSHTFSNEGDSYYISSTFDLSQHTNPMLSFKVKCDYTDDWGQASVGHLHAQYSEDGGNTWVNIQGADDLCFTDWGAWHDVKVALPAKKIQIRFNTSKFWMDNAYLPIYIDNLSITADPFTQEPQDLTAIFDVENNVNYSIYNGTEWTTAKIAYNGSAGSVNAIDSAMLSDGTAILTYTVRTGDDVTTTETFYTVIKADGEMLTTGRLTSDEYTDTNAQATAVNEDGGYFVLGWYSEHDAGEGTTSEYDDNGNATEKAVVAHDIRLARINANGSYDINFPESIGGTGETGITSDFHFSAPAGNTDLTNVSIVWSQRKDSDKADDAGKYELNAVRFFAIDNLTGVTASTNIAETSKNYTIDHFDVYTDADGAIHAIILGSDYSTIEGISVYDSIDLNAAAGNTVDNNSDTPNNLDILDGEAISSLKLAVGTFPEIAADVVAEININEVIPGLTTPVQFTVTNTGTDKITSITATVGSGSKDFTVNLNPNQSATLFMTYDVPEGAVSDPAYMVTSGGTVLDSGTLILNRPDVGISGMKVLRESDGTRDIQVILSNNSDIPLAGSGKTVKLAFYKDPFHESGIGGEISIPAEKYADIDKGIFTTVHTINVSALYSGDEIPEEGLTVYARAWVDETEEPDVYNNDGFVSFTGLLARNNGKKLTTDTTLEVNNGIYTVYTDIRNNSMKEVDASIPVAVILDENGEVIAYKNLQDTDLLITKEHTSSFSVEFTSEELGDKTPASAEIRFLYKVNFDVNGGNGEFATIKTDHLGHVVLPESTPTPPKSNPPVFFRGWYTAPTGGELITEEYRFTDEATVYARYTEHEHVFECVLDADDTVTVKCVSTVGDICPLEEQGRTATLKILPPERAADGYGMPNATISGIKGVVKTPNILYYNANEAGTAKVGEALTQAPIDAGKYWAEFTIGEGENATTIHVVYDIPAIEGLSFSEVTIPEYTRITDPASLNALPESDGVEALAWIYANEDSLRPDDPWNEVPKYIVYGKRYMTRPDDFPPEHWQYEDGVEYAFCYRFSYYDCNSETISVDELKNLLSNGSVEVYIEGTGSIDLQTEAEFRNVTSREELESSMNPSTRFDALTWILANREEYPMGIVMLSQRDEYTCTFIMFNPGSAQIIDGDFDYAFDMSQWDNMPIFVANPRSADIINPKLRYTVVYDANGGTGTSGEKYYVKSNIELPDGDGFSRPDLVFDGWNTKADGSGDAYKPGDKYEVLDNTTFYAQWKHVHNWTLTYSEDTHTYTANCTVPGCPNATATLHPEAVDKMYDGKDAAPYSCSEIWTEENGLPIPTVTFYQGGEKVTDGKNVGTYTAVVSLDGHENTIGEFHITKRPIIVIADDLEKHEGEEDPDLTVSYKPVGAELRFENDETYPWKIVTEGDRIYAKSGNGGKGDTTSTLTLNVTLSEAGTISFDYSFGSEDWSDYARFKVDDNEMFSQSNVGAWTSYTCDLSAGSHTLTWSYSKDGSVDRNGDFFAVDNVVIETEGDVTQADPEDKQGNTVSFDCLIEGVRFKNDSSYPWVEVTDGDRTYVKSGNSGQGHTTSTLTLNITLSEAGKLSFDYMHESEEGCDRCYFNVDDSDLFEKSGCVSWQTYSTNLSAGSHKLTWRFTKDGSYDEKGDFFAIDNLVLTTEGEIKQEDPSLALIPVLNKLEGGIAEGETLNYTISREEGNGMGTYAITVTMGENPNYDVMEVRGGTLTILESLGEPQTIDAGDVTATFGDTGVKISASITTGDGTLSYEVKSGDAVTVDSEGNITIVKAGTAVITVVASQTETYARTTKNVTVTVSPKAMTVSANNVTATVNGHPHGITVTVTDPAQGYTVKYGTTEGTYDLVASPTLTEAGTTTVYYQVTADNYVTFTGSVTLTLVNHVHKMSYTVGTGENANTITATCSNDDCPLPNNTATLTISAPNGNIVYDGAAHAALITDENGIQGDAKALYYVKGTDGTYGTASENAPVDAGTYKASITLGTGDSAVTVSVEYEIKNAALTNVSVEQSGTLTYSGTAQTPKVSTAATAVNDQTVTFTYSLTEDGEYGAMPTFTDVADSGTVYFKASAPNHDDMTGSFTVTVNRANRTAPAAPTLDTATANMIRLTEVDGCEYSMNGTTWQDSATFTGLDKNTQYTFYQRFKETANYNASPSSVDATISTTDHDHEWGNFTVSGSTITATCGNSDNGHSGETSATVTITAPTLTVYGGTGSAEATVTNNIDGIDTPTVVYTQGETVLNAAPTDAGTYKASITLGTGEDAVTASVTYTISKKAATVTVDNKSKTYGADDPTLTAVVEGIVGNDTISYTLSRAEGNNVGEYTITVNLGDNPNYDVTTTNGTLTIGKKAATVTADNKSKTYGDDDPTLTAVVEGIVGNDTISYTLSRAEGNNVGEYTITVNLGDNPNYDVTTTNGTLTIGKKAATVTADNKSKTYGDDDPTLTAVVEGIVGNDTINYTLSRAEGENVDEYVITVTLGENPNYDVTTTNAKLTIGKKAASVTADNKSKTYGDADPELTAVVEGTVGNDTINYTLSRAEGNNVDEYTITVNLGDNPNYDVTTTNGTFTIGKKAATVTADNKSKTYGDNDPALTAVVEGIVGNDTISYTLSRAEGNDVGEYTITVNLGENPNYDVTTTNGTLTIGKKAATVTADNKSKTYGDDDPTLTAVVEGIVGNDTINYTLSRAEGENVDEYVITVTLGENPNYDVTTTNAKLTIGKKSASVTADNKSKTYGSDDPALTAVVEGTVGNDTINYTLSRAEGENVDEYVITVTLGENPNYDVTVAGAKLTIVKKAVTLTADDKSKTYGDNDPALTAKATGLVGNDTLDYTLSRAEGENAGAYEITVTLGDNPNYDVTAKNGTFIIDKKAASITADNKSKTYGDADSALTATITGLVGNDTLDYKLSRAEGENAGTYEITVTLGKNPNYDVTVTNGTLTIGKKAATVTAADKFKTYGKVDPALTAKVTGLVGDDTLNYTLSRARGENVGRYAITVTLGNNPNYNVTVTNAKLTINKKSVTVVADSKSKTYGNADPALTAKVTGLVGKDVLDYTLSRAVGENVGEYAITVTLGNNPNYNVTATNAKLTIGKKAATVTADNKSKTYGDADPALTATVTGLVGNDTISYTLSRAAGENVGEYTITVTLGDNPNYNVSASGAKLTVTKAKSVVAAVTANEIKCDGTAKALVSVSGETGSGNVLYALGKDSETVPEEGWSADIPTAVNAGTYYVWYMVQGDDNHTDSEAVCVEVTIAPDYSVIPAASPSGTNEPQWTKGSKGGYVITIKESGEDNSFDHFVGVNVDGKELVKDVDYTVEKGSTIVTLKPETAEKLSAGDHTVTVIFDNGEVDTTLTVLAAKSNAGLWIALVAILLIAVVAIIVFVKKKNGTQKVKQA